MPKTESNIYEDGKALERLIEFMSDNEEKEAVIGFRLKNGKLEVDCSIGRDKSERNPSCYYADSVSEAIKESMRLYKVNESYFQKQKDKLKKFYNKINKKNKSLF